MTTKISKRIKASYKDLDITKAFSLKDAIKIIQQTPKV